MYSPYVRIFCAFVATLGLHTATTPPHPPPPRAESVPPTGMEIFLRQRLGQSIVKTICWTAALAEMATAAASARPGLWASADAHCVAQMAQRPPPAILAGTLLAAAGGLVRAACYRALGPCFTFELAIRAGHRLVTRGPYARVRHPGYAALLFAVAGTAAWHASPGSWARECGALRSTVGRAAASTYVVLTTAILGGLFSRMALEDAALQKVFGAEWDAYAERVPYKLLPWIY